MLHYNHSWNFVTAVELKKKLKSCPYQTVKEFDDKCLHFDTIPVCDGRTNGQICHNNIALCMNM